MKILILILSLCASACASEPTIKGVKVVTSPTDKVTGTVPVWNGTAWISGTNGSGSGDTIWTNNAGTIQASSTVVDGTNAVAFKLNTANTLTTDARLAEIKNNGTNQTVILQNGSTYIGPNTFAWEKARSLVYGYDLDYAIFRNQDLEGDTGVHVAYNAQGTNGGSVTYSEVSFSATKSQASLSVSGPDSVISLNPDSSNQTVLFYQNGSYYLLILKSDSIGLTGDGVVFDSDATATSTPFHFDTGLYNEIIHTSGNLFEVANDLTNKFWITFDGEVHAKDFVMEASALKTDTTTGHVGAIQVYDNDDATYRNVISFTNGNTPTATVGGVAGLTTTVQPTILKSSDGSTGLTTNITAGLVTFTIKNGIITGVSL